MTDTLSMETEDDLLARVSARVGEPPKRAARLETPGPVRAKTEPRQAWAYPGILGLTHVSTNFGEVPAHLVRPRDRLRTRGGGYLQVLRIDEYKLDDTFLEHQPDAKPIVIRKDAFGPACPTRDAYFSPGQMIMKPASGVRHELLEAREASALQYDLDRTMGMLSYFVFHLAEPALIRCDGVWVQVGG
ncbi:MAG: Hint domain-containing protein [Pseudomonadota bacterium]